MRIAQVNLTFAGASSVSTGASATSDSQQLNWAFGYALCATYTGSTAGTLKLQASVDNITFVDIDGSSVTVSTAGNSLWNVTDVMYGYFRLVFTRTSGTGLLSGEILYKGN